MEKEICENCGRAIGKLEQAFVYKGHVVCKECNKKLCDKPQEIPPSPPKSRKAPCVTNSHPPKTLHKQNWLARYKRRCGARSFAFQLWLLGWTIFMVCIFGMFMSSAMESIRPGYTESRGYPRYHFSQEEKAAAGAVGFCCPFGTWFLIALPLGIAAIATFGKDKK